MLEIPTTTRYLLYMLTETVVISPVLVVDVGLDAAAAAAAARAVEEQADALVGARPLHDGRVQRRPAVVVLAVRVSA